MISIVESQVAAAFDDAATLDAEAALNASRDALNEGRDADAAIFLGQARRRLAALAMDGFSRCVADPPGWVRADERIRPPSPIGSADAIGLGRVWAKDGRVAFGFVVANRLDGYDALTPFGPFARGLLESAYHEARAREPNAPFPGPDALYVVAGGGPIGYAPAAATADEGATIRAFLRAEVDRCAKAWPKAEPIEVPCDAHGVRASVEHWGGRCREGG